MKHEALGWRGENLEEEKRKYQQIVGFALAQWYGVGLRFVRSRVRSPAPLSYSEITSGCCDLALAPYGRIHVVNLTMAHMILGSIVHWRHYH